MQALFQLHAAYPSPNNIVQARNIIDASPAGKGVAEKSMG
jgi:hypothetical protein